MEEKPSTNTPTNQQQLNLRWNNHTNNILQVFTEHFTSEDLVDVTLACEGHYIKAHKMILSACSPYFQDLFRVHTASHPVIIINGMKYTDVKQVIDFMYRGEVKVLEAELGSLLQVAESLQVKGLSTVRNNYENKDITESNSHEATNAQSRHIPILGRSKKRKLTKEKEEEKPQKEELSDEESLSGMIKIEPPEIKDIDQDEKLSDHENVFDAKPAPKIIRTKSGRAIRQKTYSNIEPYSSTRKKIVPPIIQTQALHLPVDNQTILENYKNTKELKIPRPPNAFMIFANEWRRKLAADFPKESNKEISVRLGVMWKNLTSDGKEKYYSASRKADEEHKLKYPGYYYSPKEARMRKTMKDSMGSFRSKKNCDAMRFVKLVMTTDTESDGVGWREPSDQEELSYVEDETMTEEVELNNSEEADIEEKISNFKIETGPNKDPPSSPKE